MIKPLTYKQALVSTIRGDFGYAVHGAVFGWILGSLVFHRRPLAVVEGSVIVFCFSWIVLGTLAYFTRKYVHRHV